MQDKINGRNLFKAVNEHAISLVNYYIGILKLEPYDYARLDNEIRTILTKYKIHFQPSCKERLYLPRTEMSRGLCSVEHRSEQMLLQLRMQLEKDRHTSIRRATILCVGKKIWTNLTLIVLYLSSKYNINQQDLEITKLINIQKTNLYNKIKHKYLHSKLCKCAENELVDLKGSSIWLKKGNIKVVDEAVLCFFQDRNLFYGKKVKCRIVIQPGERLIYWFIRML
ncbi:hypothetical protein NUSPORA_01121 [Nucleospora cyclopteri]